MREHMGLFRGKRIDNGEWIEGRLISPNVILPCGQTLHIYTLLNELYVFPEEAVCAYFVDPDTVGECTGLRDKNGKLIFEGDIISIRFESDYEPPSAPDVWYENAKIVFSDKYHAWHAVFGDGYECSLWEYDNCDDVFAIGNIHDNPEPLKGGEGDG